MTLSDFATLSTALSGLGVAGSLIYLAIQTRQNARHTRALIQQGAAARTTTILLANQNPESARAWIAGNGGSPGAEEIRQWQFNLLCETAINAMADLQSQHDDRLLSAEQFGRNCLTFRGLLSEPGFHAYWLSARERVRHVAPRFCAFVDHLAVDEATELKYRV